MSIWLFYRYQVEQTQPWLPPDTIGKSKKKNVWKEFQERNALLGIYLYGSAGFDV